MSRTITLNNDRIRQAIRAAGYGTPPPGMLHILGVRGAVPVGGNIGGATLTLGGNQPDRYDDSLVLFGTRMESFRASVDPGMWYTKRPLHPDGCAHLCNGGPYPFEFGDHRGRPALIQAAPFTYWRDADRDGRRDNTTQEQLVRRGVIGLDIHAGGTSAVVGPNSAACQVIFGGWTGAPWTQFYAACNASGQRRLLFWLLDAETLSHVG